MNEIGELWEKFKTQPYPHEAHIDEVELEIIDNDIAGCIQSFVRSNGELEQQKLVILQDKLAELRQATPIIPEEAKPYFSELEELATKVLTQAGVGL